MPEKVATESLRLDKNVDYYDSVGVSQFEFLAKELEALLATVEEIATDPAAGMDDDRMRKDFDSRAVAVFHRIQQVRRSVGIEIDEWQLFQTFDMGYKEMLQRKDQKRRADAASQSLRGITVTSAPVTMTGGS